MSAEIIKTPISGVYELRSTIFADHRGAFLNAFRSQESAFADIWGDRPIAQVNISRTQVVGTIRGLHYQVGPHAEAKLVRCLRGRVWDVAVDLRPQSMTYGHWHGVELSFANSNSLMIPEGCAHGFQVLEPASELLYLHSGDWVKHAEAGIRWDDARVAIKWPQVAQALSERDQALPFLEFSS